MQFQLYRKENLPVITTETLRIGIPVLVSLIALSTVAVALEYIPTEYYLATSIICVALIFVAFKLSKNTRSKAFLRVEDTYLEYFSEDMDEIVQIGADEIEKVCTRFCEIQVYTRDHSVHRIDTSVIKKQQTRWEVKEMIKNLAQPHDLSTVVA
jgi:hypothetical protein